MSASTHLVARLINDFSLHHPEVPLSALAGQPDLSPVGACMALWNPPTSGYKVYIKNMKVINQQSQDTVTGTASMSIQRVTSYTTNDMTATVAYIVPMDSTNNAIPAEVKIYSRVDSVSGGSATRNFMVCPVQSSGAAAGTKTVTLPLSSAMRMGQVSSGMNMATVQSCGYGNSSVQPWTLNEGEGIALVPNTVVVNAAYRYSIMFQIGSYTYMAMETIRPAANMVPMLIYNGAGSGVVIQILQIEAVEIGTAELTLFSVQKIDGCLDSIYSTDASSGIINMDSMSPCPSSIKVYENVLVSLYGAKHGAIIANPAWRRSITMWQGAGPTWASGTRMLGVVASSEIIDNSNNLSRIVLWPGEGIALMQKNSSGMGRYEVTMLFQVESEGEYSLTRNDGSFPANHVEQGKYGTFGNKLTPSTN